MSTPNDIVIFRWVQHNEGSGEISGARNKGYLSSRSMSYQGPSLYSYRKMIARYYGTFVLFDKGHYSMTTQRHMNMARRQVSYPYFEVPHVSPGYSLGRDDMHRENLAYLVQKVTDAAMHRVSSWHQNPHDGDAISEVTERHGFAVHYANETGMSSEDIPSLAIIIGNMLAARKLKKDKFYDPKAVARRERQAARRAAETALLW
jgi:hypothetical protein